MKQTFHMHLPDIDRTDCNNLNVVFDMDGTLSDDRHRRALAPTLDGSAAVDDASKWNEYVSREESDRPHFAVLSLLTALRDARHRVKVVTGRLDARRTETKRWLSGHGALLDDCDIHMRKDPGMTPVDFKREVAEAFRIVDFPVSLAFDDDDAALDVYRALGVAAVDARQFWGPEAPPMGDPL